MSNNTQTSEDGRKLGKQVLLNCGFSSVKEEKLGRKVILVGEIDGITKLFSIHSSGINGVKEIKVGKPYTSNTDYTLIMLDIYDDTSCYCPTTAQVDWSTKTAQRRKITREGKPSTPHHTLFWVDYEQDRLTPNTIHNIINIDKFTSALRTPKWRNEKAHVIEQIKMRFELCGQTCEIVKDQEYRDILITDEYGNHTYFSVWISKNIVNPDKTFMDGFNKYNSDGEIFCVSKDKISIYLHDNGRNHSKKIDYPHGTDYINMGPRKFNIYKDKLYLYFLGLHNLLLLDELPDKTINIISDEPIDNHCNISEYYTKLYTTTTGTNIEELNESIKNYELGVITDRAYREWELMKHTEDIIQDLTRELISTKRILNRLKYQMGIDRGIRDRKLSEEERIKNKNADIKRKNEEQRKEAAVKQKQSDSEYSEYQAAVAEFNKKRTTPRDTNAYMEWSLNNACYPVVVM